MPDSHPPSHTPPGPPPPSPGPPDTALYDELNDFVVDLGNGGSGWGDCGLSNAQVKELATTVGPQFMTLAKRWYSELKAKGSNPYNAITASHDGILALQPQLLAWAKGQEYDPESAQIKTLKAQLAGAEADIKAGAKREDTNYDRIVAQLKALGVEVAPLPPTTPARPPGGSLPGPLTRDQRLDEILLRLAKKTLGIDAKTLEELSLKIGAELPPPPLPGTGPGIG